MWSPERRRLLRGLAGMSLVGAAAACGFSPALGPGGASRAIFGRVHLSTPPRRLGFALREALEARLGRPTADADLRLTTDLELTETGLAITVDSAITRFALRGVARWRLTGPEGVAPIEGVEEALTAYSATESLFATRAARRDAEARLVRELGIRIADAAAAALDG